MVTKFCVICGTGIQVRYSMGSGINYPICRDRDCIKTYLAFQLVARAPLIKKSDHEAYLKQRSTERYDGFCGRCGKPVKLDFRHSVLRHGTPASCENAPSVRDQPKDKSKDAPTVWVSRVKRKPKPRVYLKPWQDPESLFCDTEFLETKIVKKKIRKGEECGD